MDVDEVILLLGVAQDLEALPQNFDFLRREFCVLLEPQEILLRRFPALRFAALRTHF